MIKNVIRGRIKSLLFILPLNLIIYSIYMKIHVGAPGGYTTIIVVICFMFTVLFFLLGIIGEYLSVILGEIRRRPIYLVRDTVNLEKEQEKENEYI